MTPTVNVIYIRGTVAALGRFAPLLTTHTPWTYRLVANGCPPDEVALLHHIAAQHEHLTVHDLSTGEVIPLGKALCQLADTFAHEEFFAFMDSDIVVTADITGDLTTLLERHDAVFTGTPIWAQPEDTILTRAHREVCGPHTHTKDGLLLGGSYAGICHRTALDDVRPRCHVTADKYTAADLATLTPGFRGFLADHQLLRDDYTPMKLLTLAFAYTGHTAAYTDIDALHHIGGFSMTTYQQQLDAGTAADPATAAEIIDFADTRRHMARKRAVCARITGSFAAIDTTGRPRRVPTFPPDLEQRIRLIEDLYARHAPTVTS
ncbi:hypothetical protein [Micromonospora sp. CPCC 206061]|uniref:hypothetical protein n=1 Tax=Micromonospora sp. CPCC 206061 TaxID=3122410 RepID=UPI002FEEAC2C